MTYLSQFTRPSRKLALGLAVVAGPLALAGAMAPAYFADSEGVRALFAQRLHGPDLELLGRTSPVILIHLAFGVLALAVGAILMAGRKGVRMHRLLGWAWVVAVGAVAITSLFIRTLNPGGFSFIHLLSGYVIIALPLAVAAARRHDVERHRRYMTGMFLGGFAVNIFFVLLPGR
ncbi:MAG: DUF2306 domain-containing protein, partial [Phenylobacterium sp.]